MNKRVRGPLKRFFWAIGGLYVLAVTVREMASGVIHCGFGQEIARVTQPLPFWIVAAIYILAGGTLLYLAAAQARGSRPS